MDSWANGKERLLEDVAKVYDAIGANLVTELDQENTVRVQKTEWHALKEELTRCSELVEENARLAGELERVKGTVSRVEDLEQENRRLQRELAAELEEKEQEFVTLTRARLLNKPSPTPSNPAAVTVTRAEHSGADTVSGDLYNNLVKKQNITYTQWKYQKREHERLEEVCTKYAERLELWKQAVEDSNAQIAKKNRIIKKLKATGERLESGSAIGIGASEDEAAPRAQSVPSLDRTSMNKPWLGAVAGMTFITDLPATKSITANDEIGRDLDDNVNTSRELAARPNAEDENTPDLLLDLAEELGMPTGRNEHITYDSEGEEDEGEVEAELSLPKLPRLSEKPDLSEHHNSDTTDDEDIGPRTVEQVSQEIAVKVASSSSPVLVSTRQVKKRKSAHGAKTPAAKVKLEELGSSSPTHTPSSDSLDLDDIGQKTATPRKKRRLTDISMNQQSTAQASRNRVCSQLRHVAEQVSQETPIRRVETTRTGSALQPLSVNKQILLRAPTPKDPKRRRIPNDNAIGLVTEDGAELVGADAVNEPERTDILAGLLDKPSPEKQILSPIRSIRSIVAAKKQRDSLSKSGLTIHHDVTSEEPVAPRQFAPRLFVGIKPRTDLKARDDFTPRDDFRAPRQPEDRSRPTSASSSKAPRKSEGSSRSPFEEMTEPQRLNFKGFANSTKTTPLPKSRTSSSLFSKNASYTTPVQAAKTSSKSTDRRRHARTRQTVVDRENDPEQEPLRIRPVQTLRLEDFKINPNYNQGYKHAFVEVVRDKDQRQQLHACTKPGCCGEKFRALAMVGRNFDVPRTSAEKISDDRMMKEFLGDNAHKLARMTKDEKDDLWIQARTRQLAQQHGRHRNAYERQPTPPGFWEVDFPTTQEQQEQREKAEEAKRLNVKQRYEEAMRPNGAYTFADE